MTTPGRGASATEDEQGVRRGGGQEIRVGHWMAGVVWCGQLAGVQVSQLMLIVGCTVLSFERSWVDLRQGSCSVCSCYKLSRCSKLRCCGAACCGGSSSVALHYWRHGCMCSSGSRSTRLQQLQQDTRQHGACALYQTLAIQATHVFCKLTMTIVSCVTGAIRDSVPAVPPPDWAALQLHAQSMWPVNSASCTT